MDGLEGVSATGLPDVVVKSSIKHATTNAAGGFVKNAIGGVMNGLAQNLQQINTAQQVGQQGGGVLNQSLINTGFSLIPQKPKPADYNNWNSIDKNVFDVLGFKPRNKYTLNDNDAPWMRIAKSQVGIGEKTNHNDGPDVDKYLKTVGLDGSGEPWCGAFVNWGLKESGIKGAQIPERASDWQNFGQSLSRPAFGSIATMKRPGGGHVGFTAAIDADRPGWIIILGGNQSDQVSYRSFPKRILKFNYPKNFTPSYDLPSMSGIPKGIKMQ